MNVEIAELRQLLKELIISQRETKLIFEETDSKFKETYSKFKEAQLMIKETSAQLKQTDKKVKEAFDLFTSQWGRLMESLVEGDILKLFRARGIKVHNTSMRRKGKYEGQNFEFDIIAHNGTETVFVEVKTTLKVKDVKDFIVKMKNVRTWLNMDEDEVIYGAVAFLQADASSELYAQNQKLFVIRATGDSAAIINDSDFIPGKF